MARATAGHYKDWLVTRRKVEKWLGTWMYFLAFPIEGSRREYWTGFEGGFGPKHCLERFGVTQTWFEMMQACFTLPTYGRPADKHDPVRRWWDALFKCFAEAIDAGHILNPDESMIQWLGKHMPGFMSVGRKPTDKGRLASVSGTIMRRRSRACTPSTASTSTWSMTTTSCAPAR